MKKLLCLLLCLTLCLSLFPAPAYAAEDTPVSINAENFPDDNFRSFVEDRFDKNNDNSLSAAEIAEVTYIDVACLGISSLQGIEFFPELTYLDCYWNGISNLDVSKNTKLEFLDCEDNALTSLDVSNNTELDTLWCSINPLTALDVSKNTNLTNLACGYCKLTFLDVSKNINLIHLFCTYNNLTALDISKNTKLAYLRCEKNKLTSLDISKNTQLIELYCSYNNLTALDVTENKHLSSLHCGANDLTSLDLLNNAELWYLECQSNDLTELDLRKCPNLYYDNLIADENVQIRYYIAPSTMFSDYYEVGSWAYKGIDYCVLNDLMNGTSTTKFSPTGSLTRGQLVTILYRMAESPEVVFTKRFSDVPAGKYYSDAVIWAANTGVVDGYPDGTFRPDAKITREQIATILYRYAGQPDCKGHLYRFPDCWDMSTYAENAMIWATSVGLINGVKSSDDITRLVPKNTATRAQIATIIMRYETDVKYGDAIEYWTFQDLHAQFYEEMAEKWNELYPDRPVRLRTTVLPFEDMHTILNMALMEGYGAPDLVDIEVGKFPFFLQGDIQLEPLNDIIEPELDNIIKARVDIYSKDDTYYGIDFHTGASVIYYNTELCEAAGIDYRNIKTWDDYKEAAKKFKAANPDKYWMSVECSDIWHMWPQLAELGGDFTDAEGNITIDTPEMAKVLQYNRDMIDEGLAVVAPGTYHHAEEWYKYMNDGNVASIVMPMWYLDRFINYMPYLYGKIAVMPLPVWEEGENRSIGQGGTATAITNQAKDLQLVKDFLAFAKLSQEGSIAAWQMMGMDPIRPDVWAMEDITHDPNNYFIQYYVNNPFDTLLEIKDEIVGHNNGENLPTALDMMKCEVLARAYLDENVDIPAMLKEIQDNC